MTTYVTTRRTPPGRESRTRDGRRRPSRDRAEGGAEQACPGDPPEHGRSGGVGGHDDEPRPRLRQRRLQPGQVPGPELGQVRGLHHQIAVHSPGPWSPAQEIDGPVHLDDHGFCPAVSQQVQGVGLAPGTRFAGEDDDAGVEGGECVVEAGRRDETPSGRRQALRAYGALAHRSGGRAAVHRCGHAQALVAVHRSGVDRPLGCKDQRVQPVGQGRHECAQVVGPERVRGHRRLRGRCGRCGRGGRTARRS